MPVDFLVGHDYEWLKVFSEQFAEHLGSTEIEITIADIELRISRPYGTYAEEECWATLRRLTLSVLVVVEVDYFDGVTVVDEDQRIYENAQSTFSDLIWLSRKLFDFYVAYKRRLGECLPECDSSNEGRTTLHKCVLMLTSSKERKGEGIEDKYNLVDQERVNLNFLNSFTRLS